MVNLSEIEIRIPKVVGNPIQKSEKSNICVDFLGFVN